MSAAESDPARVEHGNRNEAGFVLIGVIMFVVALTILAISLFSLSGYESQFFQASQNRSQAFYLAVGGVERCKYILATSHGDLNSVRNNLPLGVTYASASQGDTSASASGRIDWDVATPVEITVRSEYPPGAPHAERVTISAAYNVYEDRSLYRDAVAVPDDGHFVIDYSNHGPISIYGTIRESQDDFGTENLYGLADPPPQWTYSSRSIPIPQVSDFISHWSGAAVGAPKLQGNDYRLDDPLPAGQDFIVYSGATNPDPAGKYGLMLNGSDATLDVGAGTSEKPRTVIWLLPHGAYFDEEVTVTGNSLATLIMVVGASSDTSFSGQTGPMLGLHTGGGMTSPSVSVFLVSDGSIVFDRTNSVNASSQLNVESIFARGVYLKGPSTYPGALFTMHHDMDANEKTLIDHLYEEELLPNTLGSGHHFTLLPGWSDSLTTN